MFDSRMKSLAIRVLGEFGVDGVEPQALGSRKARLALQHLALGAGQVVPSDVLVDALWEHDPPARPGEQLAVLMSRLRSVLGKERIEHRDGGYLLRADWLDATELAALTDEAERRQGAGNVTGAAAAVRVALSLLDSAGSVPVPGEWARLRRGELDRLISRARRVAASALLAAGDWVGTVDAATAALERDPYDEVALRLLLRAYVLGGQAAAALSRYAVAREQFADELGADPSPETAELYLAILRGELAAPARPATSPTTGLVGRDDELSNLDAVAMRAHGEASVQVVVIDGEPGIGKTTLVRSWASRRAATGDTVLLASCGPLDRAMPLDALLDALARLLRRLGSETAADLLGGDGQLLGPLLDAAPAAQQPMLADSMLGPAVLYAVLVRVLRRLAERGPLVIVIDDAHLGGQPLRDWVRFVQREAIPLAVVLAVRPGEGDPPADARLHLDALSEAAAAELVGPARVGELNARAKGHPLFLTELAQQPAGAELPASLVESVSARCDELGPAGMLLRTGAVLGTELDIDLLAAVLGRPVVSLLDDAERAAAGRFLADDDGTFRFRHELAARALRHAAARAAERFDHAAAEALLDDALSLHPDPRGWLARARVRTRRGRYQEALSDVERALPAGPAALEVGAWAAYFGRRFAQSTQFADDGALAAADPATRARCLAVGGRTRHAAGDLSGAETQLGEALSLAHGSDRVTAAAWLGVIRSHQSRADDALALLRPATRGELGAEHTSATLHALLFTGHAHAVAGRPVPALAAFTRYDAEVERRQAPRFGGRAVNFAGWVLRNLGAQTEGLDLHHEALEIGRRQGTPEVVIAALQDMAEHSVHAGDADGAQSLLAEALPLLDGDLVFGWRLELRHWLVSGELALLQDAAEQARDLGCKLAERAAALGVPRYLGAGRLLRCRADRVLGVPPDLDAVAADLDLLDSAMAVEAWWWTGEVAAELGVPAWLDRAAQRAERLAANAGPHGDGLRRALAARMRGWEVPVR